MKIEINSKNLRQLCWARGLSVAELARKLGVKRPNLYRAAKAPGQHKPMYARIRRALS